MWTISLLSYVQHDNTPIYPKLRLLLEESLNIIVLLLPDGDAPNCFARKHKCDGVSGNHYFSLGRLYPFQDESAFKAC